MTTPTVLAFLAVINLITFGAFWHDKRRAVAGGRRVPENDLLRLAMIGGSPGALLARHLLRHKTRKQPFATYLLLISGVQAGGLFAWLLL